MSDGSQYSDAAITLRPAVSPDDDAFLSELYLSTREDLMGVLAEAEFSRLAAIQYAGQQRTYAEHFPSATNEIVLLGDKPVGRMLVERRRDVIHLIDIALLPEVRGMGVGTVVIRRLLLECTTAGSPCMLHVLKTNRAQKLYARLGFRVVNDDGVRYEMRWDAMTDDVNEYGQV